MLQSKIELRFAQSSDIPDASEFVLIAFNDTLMEKECVDTLGSQFTNRLEKYGPQNTLLAFDSNNNNTIVGFIDLDTEKSTEHKKYIYNIYVLPSYRKQGIASKLVEKMISERCSPGDELVIKVTSEAEKQFWEKMNFSMDHAVLGKKI